MARISLACRFPNTRSATTRTISTISVLIPSARSSPTPTPVTPIMILSLHSRTEFAVGDL